MNKKVSFIFKQINSLDRNELDSFSSLIVEKLKIFGFSSSRKRMPPFPHPVQLFSQYSYFDPFLLNSPLFGIFNLIVHLSSSFGRRSTLNHQNRIEE